MRQHECNDVREQHQVEDQQETHPAVERVPGALLLLLLNLGLSSRRLQLAPLRSSAVNALHTLVVGGLLLNDEGSFIAAHLAGFLTTV